MRLRRNGLIHRILSSLMFALTSSAIDAAMPSELKTLSEILGGEAVGIMGMHDTLGGEQATGTQTVERKCKTLVHVWSSDFGFATYPADGVSQRPRLYRKTLEMHRVGKLITLSWHQCNPLIGEPCTFKDGVQHPLSEAQWLDLLSKRGPLALKWRTQVLRIGAHLKALSQQGVTVLFRPYHEANIPGFWWASEDGVNSKRLWRQLHGILHDELGLRNIRWVWSVSFHPKYWGNVQRFYPGDDVVDLVGVDIYPPRAGADPDFDSAWTALRRLAPLKPLALTEVSRLPSQEQLRKTPWAYIVPWGINMLVRDNSWNEVCDKYTLGQR